MVCLHMTSAAGAGYFVHGGNWIQLANYTDLSPICPTANPGTNVDLHLNTAGAWLVEKY